MVNNGIKGFSKIEQVPAFADESKNNGAIISQTPCREWGSCQDLSLTSCKTTNGTVLQLLSGGELFITAVMTEDECFDGILDMICNNINL